MATPQQQALALIPARGGSKGIPGKNLLTVGGVPLIARTIQAARASNGVGRVVVSTDDEVIAATATAYGAEVLTRPIDIAGDQASSESALLHALQVLETSAALPPRLVFLQCTSPFTTSDQIDRVLAVLKPPSTNSCFAVVPWHGFLWRAEGAGINHDPAQPRQRRQELEPSYLETGAIYAMATEAFRSCGSRFCPPWRPVVILDSSPEIDSPEDLEFCRALAMVRSSYNHI